MFHLMCIRMIFIKVYVAELLPFWKELLIRLNGMFSLICLFVALVVSYLGFEDRTLVLIASVPGHCLPFTFSAFI